MRGILYIGLVVVLLIAGLLVMKSMGVDSSGDVTDTKAEQ